MPDNTVQPFKHNQLIRTLDPNQRNFFQKDLNKIVTYFKRNTPFEKEKRKFPNHVILKNMEKLSKNLNKTSELIDKFQPHFWGAYVGWKASEDDRKKINDFPAKVKLMRKILAASIADKSYNIAPHARDLYYPVALQAKQLLKKYGIETTTTEKSAWLELTKYILLHGYDSKSNKTLPNYLKELLG